MNKVKNIRDVKPAINIRNWTGIFISKKERSKLNCSYLTVVRNLEVGMRLSYGLKLKASSV